MLRLSYDKDGQCMVSVKISGAKLKEASLIVDSAARYVHIDDKICKELKLTPFGAVPIRCIHGVVDSMPRYKGRIQIDGVPYAENDRKIVGCLHTTKHTYEKAEKEREEKDLQSYSGVLGREVLASLKFTMDMKKSQAFLEQSV